MPFKFLAPFHPQIVHTPIAMLIFSALFALVGRLFDRDWLRKASVVMLVFGFLGAYFAVQSGKPAHRVPEHEQGVPEETIDQHGLEGERVMYLAGAALLALAVGSRLKGRAASAVAGLALLLHLAAAVLVGVTGYHGGKLVYEHGANVRVDGKLVKGAQASKQTHAPEGSSGEGGERR